MKTAPATVSFAALFVACALFQLSQGATTAPPLPAENLGEIETLPQSWPPHWAIIHDGAFFHMLEGKMIVMDPLAEDPHEQYKGMFNSSNIGPLAQATSRPEMYVAEIFYDRGSRGKRTDVVTVYDKSTLAPVDEIILPGRRAFTMPEKHSMQLVNDEKFLLVFNFAPATSVTVIDAVKREVLNTVDIAGCALIYPTGPSGFSSLCSDGGMYSVQLDEKGQVQSSHRMASFFDPDEEPLFEKPAIINGIAYFPTFQGMMQPMNLGAVKPERLEAWPLVSAEERKQGWRPGGWQLISSDPAGHIYLLMHPEGYEGSHKDGGGEVWVYDPQKKQRLRRLVLKNHSLSITVNAGGLLLATTIEMQVDVYRAASGKYLKTLSDFGQETPFVIYPVL